MIFFLKYFIIKFIIILIGKKEVYLQKKKFIKYVIWIKILIKKNKNWN